MGKPKNVKVNKTALKNALKSKNKSMTDVSQELGYSNNYLSSMINAYSGVPVVVANYLDKVYGIKPEAYADEEKEEKPKLTQSELEFTISKALEAYQPIDYERLYKVIYSATHEAMARALKGEES